MSSSDDLIPGYTRTPGKLAGSALAGVLRTRGATVRWKCLHEHLLVTQALNCARAELNRRMETAREVITLWHCENCSVYYADPKDVRDDQVPGGVSCPQCRGPLEPGKWVRES